MTKQVSNHQTNDIVEKLMKDYLEICHRAIHENSDKLYLKIARKISHLGTGNLIFTAIVYDDLPDNVVGKFDINFNIDNLKLKILPEDTLKTAFIWKVPLRYLKDVVEERTDWYIEQPLRLDFKWMTERIETETKSFLQKPKWLFGFAFGLAVTVVSFYFINRKKAAFH